MTLAIIALILIIIAAGGLAFYRTSPKIWTPAFAVVLLFFSIVPSISWWLLIPLWIIFLVVACVFNMTKLRMDFFTRKVMMLFRSVLPAMSDTEREALEAGDVWWEGELFCGRPDWKKLLTLPKPQLSAEEQAFMDNEVETLCSMLNDWEIVYQHADLPPEVWAYIKQNNFFGLVIDKKYGGRGFSALAHSCVVTKIATRSISTAVNVMVPNSLGPAELLHHYGTPEQKNYYLPRLAKGEEIPAFGLTSLDAGSDAVAMQDSGIVCEGEFEGKKVLGMRLNWDKRYITLAPVCTVLGLAFKLYDPNHLLGKETNIGITLCLVPTNLPGVSVGDRHYPLGLAFMNGPVHGKDVFVPLDFIIGGVEMRGKGWRMLMECLAVGRGISLPSLATAGAKLSYRTTGAYARLRRQFNVSIGQFEGVAESLARIGGYTYTCEATRFLTTTGIDLGIKPSLATAITKYHLTELSRHIANDAMDIHGGRGVQLGPRNYLGYFYQAIPVSITVEGANILTRNLIIFGQGAMRCHPYVRLEIDAVANPDQDKGLIEFDKLLGQHIGYAVSNFARTFAYGLSGGELIKAPVTGTLAPYYRQLTRMSSALALVADIAMLTLGGELKRKESISARLGDVLSQLYLASAVVKYHTDQQQPEADLPLAEWALSTCLYKIQIAFDELLANFTPKWLGRVLRFILFPWGRSYKAPMDKVSHTIAKEAMQPSAQRDRLTAGCYIGKGNDDLTGRMEHALQMAMQIEPIQAKLHEALKKGQINRKSSITEQWDAAKQAAILSDDEVKLLHAAEAMRQDAMQVDAFQHNYFMRKSTDGNKKQAKLSA